MKVSFVIVARNEEKNLPGVLCDLTKQDYPLKKIEVILIDSCSNDGTFAVMEKFAQNNTEFADVLVFKNEGKVLPSGINIALKHYTGDVFVRVDAHASVPSDFISKNVEIIKRGEDVCGGRRPNIMDESTNWKETLLSAEQSMFGSSFAPYRAGQKKMYTSSLFCGMYKREVFEKVGLYNEKLFRTEDNDMSYRIRKAGYKMCFCPDIVSYQHTRSSFAKMLKQKYLNGYWIGKTMGVSPKCFSLFHFVPFAFVLAIILTTVMAVLSFPLFSYLMWGAYLFLVLSMSIMEIFNKPIATNLLLPFIFFLLHISYGIGTLLGLIVMPFWLRKVKR